MSAVPADPSIADSVERAVREQARRNEIIITYVRAVMLLFGSILNWLVWWRPDAVFGATPEHLIRVPLVTTLWLADSVVLALVLRRGFYHRADRRRRDPRPSGRARGLLARGVTESRSP